MKGWGRQGLLAGALVGATVASRALRRRKRLDFAGKSVLIAGGSRGLGLLIARELATEGAQLTLLARTAADLEVAERELAGGGAEVLVVPCDIRDRQAAQTAVELAAARWGRVDVLFNVAGVIQTGPVEHMGLGDFEDALATHMWGPLYTMFAAIPHMKQQGGGRIVNIASIGGKVAVPHLLPYCTSKFALVGLSDGMRAELAKDRIYVTTVCPGLMRTGSIYNVWLKGQHEAELAWFSALDSLYVSSIDAGRAAHQVVEACRYGDAQLIITIQANTIARLAPLFPRLTAQAMALFNQLLPGPTGEQGDQALTGWESRSEWAPSALTRSSDRAAEENNQLRGHPSQVDQE